MWPKELTCHFQFIFKADLYFNLNTSKITSWSITIITVILLKHVVNSVQLNNEK
jgi:hypothetical protein